MADINLHDPTEIFIKGYDATNVDIDGKTYCVEILDPEGKEDQFIDMWFSFGEGFLLLFAVNDPESFEYLKELHEKLLKSKHDTIPPILLIGCKNDLENERKVSYDDAKQLAESWGTEYIETSAKKNLNCKETLKKISEKIIEYRKNCSHKSSCCLCNIM